MPWWWNYTILRLQDLRRQLAQLFSGHPCIAEEEGVLAQRGLILLFIAGALTLHELQHRRACKKNSQLILAMLGTTTGFFNSCLVVLNELVNTLLSTRKPLGGCSVPTVDV